MPCAVISDIHGNHEALTAVLADIKQRGIKDIFCLGDIVGYGAEPGKCLAKICSLTDKITAGNHDYGAVGLLDISSFNLNARKTIEWTVGILAQQEKEILSKLPLIIKSETETGSFWAVHSTPNRPNAWHYILSLDEAEYQFENFQGNLCFIGHSHQPVFWEFDANGRCNSINRARLRLDKAKRYIINAGSVGQPRDGDPRSSYIIYDVERMEVAIRRVEYDIKSAQEKIIKAGLPTRLAERLTHGI